MKKILIADNEPQVLGILELILSRSGNYEILTVRSKEKAVEVAKDNPDIRLVVLDSDCYGEGGVVDAIKSIHPECKFLLNTGGLIGCDQSRVMKHVDAVINKPFESVELMQVVSELLVA